MPTDLAEPTTTVAIDHPRSQLDPITTLETTPSVPAGGRLIGLDIARGLALIGMFTQHVFLFDTSGNQSTGWVAWLFREAAGRASVLFFVLSGISLTIISRRGSASATPGALRRRGLILLIGGILLTSAMWSGSILQHYGLAFLLAPWLLRLSRRGLGSVTALGLIGGPVVLLFASRWTSAVTGWYSGRTGSWVINQVWDITMGGTYPMVLWIGFFTFGMLLGRLDLRSTATHARLATAAVVATLLLGVSAAAVTSNWEPAVGEGGSTFNEADFNEADVANLDVDDAKFSDANFDDFDDADFADRGPVEWRSLADTAGHSGRVGWTLQTSALATAILAAALLLPRRAQRSLAPIAWMGSMSLTAYLVHIVLVNDVWDAHLAAAGWSIIGQEWAVAGLVTAMIGICAVFHRVWKVGPFERLLKSLSVRSH